GAQLGRSDDADYAQLHLTSTVNFSHLRKRHGLVSAAHNRVSIYSKCMSFSFSESDDRPSPR
ncbi:MAG: hypothetical protein ACPGR1_07135, partial [Candidatus Poseidoniaceae archaeon]